MTSTETIVRFRALYYGDGVERYSQTNCAITIASENRVPVGIAMGIAIAAYEIGTRKYTHSTEPIAVPSVSPTTPVDGGTSPALEASAGDPLSETSESKNV